MKVLRLNSGQIEEVEAAVDGTLMTALSALSGASLASGDLFLVVDVSDTSADASGTAKTITKTELASALGGGGTWTEVELDFGTNPVWSKSFTISDAAVVSTASQVICVGSSETATGRAAGDAEWDGLIYAAHATGAGTMSISAIAHPGPVVGKRKALYQVI